MPPDYEGDSAYFHAASKVGDSVLRRYVAEQGGTFGMTVRGKAYISGIFEHPTRLAPNKR